MSRADVASSVHVENGSAAAAGGPGVDAGVSLEIKVAAVVADQADAVVDVLSAVAGEGKGVGALALGALGNLGEANHVGIEDGEPVMCLLVGCTFLDIPHGEDGAAKGRTGSPGQTAY